MNAAPTLKLKPTAPRYAGGGTPRKAKKPKMPKYADAGTISTQYVSNILPGTEPAYGQLVDDARTITDLEKTPYQPYEGARVAKVDPLQEKGFAGIANLGVTDQSKEAGGIAGLAANKALATSYNPNTFNTYGTGAQQTSTGSFLQPGTANAYMNPYMQNVVDIQKREATRQDDIARTGRNAQAVGAGAFGGSRQAIVEAEAGRNLQQRLGDIQTQGSDAAFKAAQGQFNTEQELGLKSQVANQGADLQYGTQFLDAQKLGEVSKQFGATTNLDALKTGIAGATALSDVGNDVFKQDFTAATGQAAAGADARAITQQGLDEKAREFDTQQLDPYKRLSYLSDILHGTQGAVSNATATGTTTTPPASNMQNLTGLASILYGATNKKAAGGSIDGGLARIAPDSVGDFADGGIVGFAEAGSIDPQIAADREMYGRWWDTVKDESAHAGAAIADIGTLVPRGLAGAYDTAVVRPMRAAGLPAGYLSGHLVPEGVDPGSMTPFYDSLRMRDPKEPEAKKGAPTPAAKKAEPPGPGPIPAPAAKTGAAGPGISALVNPETITVPTGMGGGGGGGAPSYASMYQQLRKATGYDELGKTLRTDATAVADAERANAIQTERESAALYDKYGPPGKESEKRLAAEIGGHDQRVSDAKSDAFIQAGLAILAARPGDTMRAIAEGAQKGFTMYQGSMKELLAKKERLEDKRDALMEAQRQWGLAKGEKKLALDERVRNISTDLQKQFLDFSKTIGIANADVAKTVFPAWVQVGEGAKNRASHAGIAALQANMEAQKFNATSKQRASEFNQQMALYRDGFRGTGAGKTAMTLDQYIDNVRQQAKQYTDAGMAPAEAEAKAEETVNARRLGGTTSARPGFSSMTVTPDGK